MARTITIEFNEGVDEGTFCRWANVIEALTWIEPDKASVTVADDGQTDEKLTEKLNAMAKDHADKLWTTEEKEEKKAKTA